MIMEKRRFQNATKNFIFFTLLLLSNFIYAQTTIIKGSVRDAETKVPVAFASIYFKEGKGITADSLGRFEIATERNFKELLVSYIGYKTAAILIQQGKEQIVNVELVLDASKDLNAVVIKSKNKIKYSNKNNPAVELIRQVIANKDKNRP